MILIPTPVSFNSVWFVDRAHIWINQEIYCNGHLLAEISPYCADATYQERKIGYCIHLSQPTPMAFKILSDYRGVGEVFYIELAWDFITNTQDEAEKLENWIRSHLIELRRGSKRVYNFKTTRYSGNRNQNPTAMYANRQSKIAKKPCVHLEWRISGARSVSAAIGNLKSLVSIDDSAHMQFWNRRVRFIQINSTKLGRIVLGRTRIKGRYIGKLVFRTPCPVNNWVYTYDHLLRAGSIFRRAYGLNLFGEEDAQILVDKVRRRFHVDYTKFTDTIQIEPN